MKAFKFLALALAALTLMGCPGGPDSKDFKITVSNVTESKADLLVEPADTTAMYYLGVYDSEDVVTLSDDSIASIINTEFNYYLELFAMMGYEFTLEELLQELLFTGKLEDQLSDLTPATDYTVIAVKMDVQGNVLGKMARKNFTTLEAVMGQLTFTFENTGSSVIVTPSNDYEPWDYYLLSTAEYQEYYNSDKKAAAEDCYAYYGTELAAPGIAEFDFSVLASEGLTGDVVLLTYACTAEGITSEVAEYQFNIPAPAGAPAKKVAKETIANFKKMMNVEKKFNAIKAMKK